MMLRWSFGLNAEAEAIERAVGLALQDGLRCKDIAVDGAGGVAVLGTREMAEAVAQRL